MPYCDVAVKSRAFDKAQAISMLEEAGWTDTDGDNIREKDGVKLSGEMIYMTGNAMLGDLALAIQAQLKEIGVEAIPTGIEMLAYYQATLEGKFGLALAQTYGLNYDPMTTVSNMNPSMHIDPVSEQAVAGLPDAAGLINTLNSTADEQVVKDAYKTILTEINDSAAIIPISYIKQLAVYNTGKIESFAFNGQPDNVDLLKIKVK
jgi:nickel transport system substrate-binding protein